MATIALNGNIDWDLLDQFNQAVRTDDYEAVDRFLASNEIGPGSTLGKAGTDQAIAEMNITMTRYLVARGLQINPGTFFSSGICCLLRIHWNTPSPKSYHMLRYLINGGIRIQVTLPTNLDPEMVEKIYSNLTPEQRLVLACHNCDAVRIRALLASGVDPNNFELIDLLACAARDDIIEIFFEFGVDPELRNPKTGASPIEYAISRRHINDMYETFFEHGVYPSFSSLISHYKRLMDYLISRNSTYVPAALTVMNYLVSHGVKPPPEIVQSCRSDDRLYTALTAPVIATRRGIKL